MPDDNELLFVYGSLRNPATRLELLKRPIEASPARLPGYERRDGRYNFVVERAGASTDGAILEGLNPSDFAILDAYEEVPQLYTRDRVEVLAPDGRHLECWIYLPTAGLRKSDRRGRSSLRFGRWLLGLIAALQSKFVDSIL